MRRVLAIYLDGYEQSLAARYMAAGDMPAMTQLATASARWLLDHGPAQRTGLAGEHFATGLSPDDAHRWAAVDFDPSTYRVWQVGTERAPFTASLGVRTVVFDHPYFRLDAAPNTLGLVNWGAHDPGVATTARPGGLQQEFLDRFGAYPATRWVYGFAWPSAAKCREMGERLAQAVEVRAQAARWLLSERLPDWDLAIVSVSEPHSVIEGLWHGVDPGHPLHNHPSASAAADGMRAVYSAVDRLVGDLVEAFPDAVTVVVSMGGMGPNRSDVASMLLLPELLHRHACGKSLFATPSSMQPPAGPGEPPLLSEDTKDWGAWVLRGLPPPDEHSLARRAWSSLRSGINRQGAAKSTRDALVSELDWMPARAYQPWWHGMRMFALPSFYDGRVRINLRGRERDGKVRVADYAAAVREVEDLLQECVDTQTGQGVVECFERPAHTDPLQIGPTESDLVVVWKGLSLGFEHPRLGRIGPVPFRRTGGHTGPHGIAYLAGAGVAPGLRGIASAFDVVPTMLGLLGASGPAGLSGRCLLPAPHRCA